MENRGFGGRRGKEGSFKRASIKRTSSGSQKVRDLYFDHPQTPTITIYREYVKFKWKNMCVLNLFCLGR